MAFQGNTTAHSSKPTLLSTTTACVYAKLGGVLEGPEELTLHKGTQDPTTRLKQRMSHHDLQEAL